MIQIGMVRTSQVRSGHRKRASLSSPAIGELLDDLAGLHCTKLFINATKRTQDR